MLVKNISGVPLKCNEFGIRPFTLQPDEVKDIPDAVATLWLAINEKPIEAVAGVTDVVEEDAENILDEEEDIEDVEPEDVPRKRRR